MKRRLLNLPLMKGLLNVLPVGLSPPLLHPAMPPLPSFCQGVVAWSGVPVTAVTLAVLAHVTHLYSVVKYSNLGQIDRSKFVGSVD
jgi:hypothetical protein